MGQLACRVRCHRNLNWGGTERLKVPTVPEGIDDQSLQMKHHQLQNLFAKAESPLPHTSPSFEYLPAKLLEPTSLENRGFPWHVATLG